MMKKLLLTLLALCGGIACLLCAAYWFRDPLLKLGANRALAATQISITTLRGVEFDARHLTLAELNLNLPSGQELSFTGIELRFALQTLRDIPVPERLDIISAHLTGTTQTEATPETSAPSLRVNELLAQLRGLALPPISINELIIPQWHDALRLTLQPAADGLDLDAASGALHLGAQFRQAAPTAPAQLQMALTRFDAILGDLHLILEPGADTHALDGSGRLVFDDLAALMGELQQAAPGLSVPTLQTPPLRSADLSWRLSGNVADDLYGTLDAANATSFVFGLRAGSTFTVPEGVIAEVGDSTLSFPDDVSLTIATGAGLGVSTGQMTLQLTSRYAQEPLSLDGKLLLNHCLLDAATACNLDFNGNAAYGSYAASGSFAFSLGNLSGGPGAYRVKTSNLALKGLPPDVPAFDVDAALTLTDTGLSFTTPLALRGTPAPLTLAVNGNYTFKNSALALRLTTPRLAFAAGSSALSAWLRAWPYPFDILNGAVTALAVDARWQPDAALTATVKGQLQDVGGFYDNYAFAGLNGQVETTFTIGDRFTLATPPLNLSVANLQVGVPVTNVNVSFQIDRSTQVLRIASFAAKTMGGALAGENLRYDWNAASNALTLRFSALDVAQMLTLVGYDGVTATGKLSGEIPLTLNQDGVVVTSGELHANDPGGTIHYQGAATASKTGNAQLDLVNQILSNFQFHTLTSSIDYTPTGDLLLGMQLQGYNPDLGSNQPINLNLNLSNNIPALLRSLRATSKIEDFLQEQFHGTAP
ncbi:MAG: YdbH domain-containing protein [Pseudomonadales bacterium]|jgi:hypothetical protein|nr:YdbH domain-containing protein [Pseudomonadales bacterium]